MVVQLEQCLCVFFFPWHVVGLVSLHSQWQNCYIEGDQLNIPSVVRLTIDYGDNI